MNTSVTLSCLTISMFSICIWLHCESAGEQVRLWNLIWQKSQLKRCTKQDPGCWVLQQEMLGERQRRRQPRIISGLWPDKFNLFARCRQLCSVDSTWIWSWSWFGMGLAPWGMQYIFEMAETDVNCHTEKHEFWKCQLTQSFYLLKQ